MAIRPAGKKTAKASVKAGALAKPASKKVSAKGLAAERGGAKFGGVNKRGPTKIHRLGESSYRDKPYFKTPKLMAVPRITLEQAYRATDLPEIRTVKGVSLVSLRKAKISFEKGPLKGFLAYRARTYTMENRHRHEVVLMFEPDDNGHLRASSRIIFSCSCRRQKFQWEYANAKVGLSFIYFSNGQPPVIKNPGLKFQACKHSLRVVSHLLRKQADKSGSKTAKVRPRATLKQARR